MNNFRAWLLAEFGNKNTAKSYYYTVKRFLDKYELTEENITKYASELIEKSKSTQNQFIKAINTFMKYKKVDFNVPKYKTVDKKIHDYITKEELEEKIIPKLHLLFQYYVRITVAFRFLFYTGLRREEFLNLERKDFDFESLFVIVRGTKGKRDRKVPFPKVIVKDIKGLFLTEIERQGAFNISTFQLDRIMTTINEEELFEFKIHPHLFRHSSAKNMVKDGVDVSIIQKVLGHSSIETTLIYVDPDEKMVGEIYHRLVG